MSRMDEPKAQGQKGSPVEQVKDAAADVGKQLRDAGSQVRDAASKKYEDLRDQASEYYEQGRERAEEWEQTIESYVQEKPVKALLLAAGVGFLMGAIWKRH